MHEDFETELRESVAHFNEDTVPAPVASVRARGERLHRQKVIGTVAVALSLVAGLGIAAVGAASGDGQHAIAPTTPPMTTVNGGMSGSVTTRPLTTAPAQQPQRTSASPPSSPKDSANTSGNAPISLTLSPPTEYAAGVLNPVTFTVQNHGSAVTVTADLTLARPKSEVANTTGPWPLDLIERHDPVTGAWTKVTVTFLDTGGDPHREDVRAAHYTFDLPSGTSTEQLRIDPEGSFFALGVKLTAGSLTLAQAQTEMIPVNFPALTVSGPKAMTPGGTGEFDITVANRTSMDYPSIAFWTSEIVTFSPISSASQVQVYDGGAWHTVSFDQLGTAVIATRPLASGATTTVRLRLTLATTATANATGDLGIRAYVPGEFNASDTSPGLAPGGETRTDTSFAVR
ncbi:hypothetical protein [Catenulispora subtropica]|uniref:DUF11 domain-containing protein n=1 Tax=Catenulispora subtropica TaxID=450798 RepID=A0ABP5CES0_9ACTN